MDDSSEAREMASGQPGVPIDDQRPTNEGKEGDIVADVDIPGPYPSGRGDPTGEPLSSEPEPTKETREAGSLGGLVHGSDTPAVSEKGESGAPVYQHDPETPEGKIERARAESYPGGVPEDADVGTGRKKGQGMPPGSVGKGHDTPQTPAT